MHIKWRNRLEMIPSLRDINTWPSVDQLSLPRTKRKDYIRNWQIVSKVLLGHKLKTVAKEHNVTSPFISYLMKRCLSADESNEPALTAALIPDNKLQKGVRCNPLSDINNPRGSRGSFNYLLDTVTGLKDNLDKMLIAFIKNARFSQNVTPKIFHAEFIRILRDNNWPQTRYPFDQVNLGYESCRKYFHLKLSELKIPKQRKQRIISTITFPSTAYQEIEIDSQTIDVTTSLNIELNNFQSSIRMSRLTLFIAKDVATNCILSYHLCLTKSPTQFDLLNLLYKIHKKWEPLDLKTPGLKYEPGACLPSSLGEEYQNVGLNMIRLDNALCHMSHLVNDYICSDLGATLNLGLPAHPKGRNVIEYAFKLLNEHTHRFASTTGSHPKDDIKETSKNSKRPQVITLSALEEILSIIITTQNTIPQNRLNGLSPLHAIKQQMNSYPIRIDFGGIHNHSNPFILEKEVSICWNKKENRAPHINFSGTKYTGDGLRNKNIINKKVIIKYDSRDIRKLVAYTNKGQMLGELLAPRSWQVYAHSIDTRRHIMKVTKRNRRLGNDPLTGYFEYLLENKELPVHATELLRIYREFNTDNIVKINCKNSNTNLKEKSKLILKSKNPHIAKWTPQLAIGGNNYESISN